MILLNFKWKGQVPETRVSMREVLSILKAADLRAAIKARRIIEASRNGLPAERVQA
jgi:hypothetical protein